jgi:hypothetical protein
MGEAERQDPDDTAVTDTAVTDTADGPTSCTNRNGRP